MSVASYRENTSKKKDAASYDKITIDTVNISAEARKKMEQSVAARNALVSKTGSDMIRDNKSDDVDLNALKEKLGALKESKSLIHAEIDKALKANGIDTLGSEKLKIEIDPKGKIIIGGIADAKKMKAIETALNGPPNLAKKIKDYREQEAELSNELEAATGTSLKDLRNRIQDVQKDIFQNGIPIKSSTGESYSKEEMMVLKDQDINWIDPGLTEEITDFFDMDSSIDMTPGNDILSDPVQTMNSLIEDIRNTIERGFKENNSILREKFNPKTEEDEQQLLTMMQSLNNVTIRINGDGTIAIEGKVAEDARVNEQGIQFIEEYIQDMMKDNPTTGDKNNYKIAAERLVNLYEDEDEYEDNINSDDIVTTIKDGTIETHLSSTQKEKELTEDIQADFNQAIKQMGVPLKEKLDITIDDTGKINVSNIMPDPKQQEIVQALLDELNKGMTPRDNSIHDNTSTKERIVTKIRNKLDQYSLFLPGGAAKIQTSFFDE